MTAPVLYLFDIDGTILLSGGAGSVALNRVFESQHGILGAMDDVDPAGKTDPLIVVEMFENKLDRQPTQAEIAGILDPYVAELNACLARSTRFRLMPKVVETLDFLAAEAHVHLSIATGNIRSAARAKLERADLWCRFTGGGFGDDASDRAKLVQCAIDRGRRDIGDALSNERIVVVGDTPRDVSAARACGVRVLAVATGSRGRASLEATGADAVFDTLAELPTWHTAHMR